MPTNLRTKAMTTETQRHRAKREKRVARFLSLWGVGGRDQSRRALPCGALLPLPGRDGGASPLARVAAQRLLQGEDERPGDGEFAGENTVGGRSGGRRRADGRREMEARLVRRSF